MATALYKEHWQAEHHVFGLHGVTKGKCDCGNPHCKALHKHPKINKWQLVPHWSEEQLANLAKSGMFDHGYGVLCKGMLVVDIDPRNGGSRIPELEKECGYIVATGGGGWHYYFTVAEDVSLQAHTDEYKGVDFKSSGYVVGAGSKHTLGEYKVESGSVDAITPAPEWLLKILSKKETVRVVIDGHHADISFGELQATVMAIPDYDSYDTFVKVGMGIHDTVKGSMEGLALWDKWAAQSDKYHADWMPTKWNSFGKSVNSITYATLCMLSEYEGEVTFEAPEIAEVPQGEDLDVSHIDLTKPPGIVGKITEYINNCCLFPREHLAAAVAVQVASIALGDRCNDPLDGLIPNLFVFGVAGSSTGKEAVLQAMYRILIEVELGSSIYGGIKSEQEIVRNMLTDKTSVYAIDEIGMFLSKVNNAAKSGAHYLENLMGKLMESFSKSDGYMMINGDLKKDVIKELSGELSRLEKKLDDGDNSEAVRVRMDEVQNALTHIDKGIVAPFASITGFTTPETFEQIVTRETVTSGFFARSIVVKELETNPRFKGRRGKGYKDVPGWLVNSLLSLMSRERVMVETTPEAEKLIDEIRDYFFNLAESHKGSTGLEAVPRRGYELVAKVSLTLSAFSGVRGSEEVLWAFALIKDDVLRKINLAVGNELCDLKSDSAKYQAIMARIVGQLSKNHSETEGVLINRLGRRWKRELILSVLADMVSKGILALDESDNGYHKSKEVRRYKIT